MNPGFSGLVYPEWIKLLDPNEEDLDETFRQRDTFAVHVYNKLSNGKFTRYGTHPKAPFRKLFRDNCPLTFHSYF